MQTRREWLNSSLGIGGLLLAPTSILSAQEKIQILIQEVRTHNPFKF